MTSAQAITLAETVIRNDPQAIEPLLRLLYFFKSADRDPATEAIAADVLRRVYSQTEHYEKAFARFFDSSPPEQQPHKSIAA